LPYRRTENVVRRLAARHDAIIAAARQMASEGGMAAVQIAGERLRVRADHVIAEMVTGLGGKIIDLQAPFDPEIGAYHVHE